MARAAWTGLLLGLFFLGTLLGRPAVAEAVVQQVTGAADCCACACPCADADDCGDEHAVGCTNACDHCACHFMLLAILPALPPLRLPIDGGRRGLAPPTALHTADVELLFRPPRAP
ncbi:MAG: hypothetical protein R3F60_02155 [bacterium]